MAAAAAAAAAAAGGQLAELQAALQAHPGAAKHRDADGHTLLLAAGTHLSHLGKAKLEREGGEIRTTTRTTEFKRFGTKSGGARAYDASNVCRSGVPLAMATAPVRFSLPSHDREYPCAIRPVMVSCCC